MSKEIQEVSFVLPVIPPPVDGDFAIIQSSDEYSGPYFSGDGPVNLHCGRCMNLLVYHLHPGQITNLVLRCSNSKCKAYNAIVSIPTLENLVEKLQKASATSVAQLPDLIKILSHAQKHKVAKDKLFTGIRHYMPDFGWIEKLVVPENAGDFYSLVGTLIALIAWYQSNKPKKKRSRIVVNEFLGASKME